MGKGALLAKKQQGFGGSAVLCDFFAVDSIKTGGRAVMTSQGA